MTYDKESPCPFNKYKGVPLKDVPDAYLVFCYDNMRRDSLGLGMKMYIKTHVKEIVDRYLTDDKNSIKE